MRNIIFNGKSTDHLGFTNERYTAILDGVTYEVRISTHPAHGAGYVVKGMNDYGETYSVHHGTDLGKAIIEQVYQER